MQEDTRNVLLTVGVIGTSLGVGAYAYHEYNVPEATQEIVVVPEPTGEQATEETFPPITTVASDAYDDSEEEEENDMEASDDNSDREYPTPVAQTKPTTQTVTQTQTTQTVTTPVAQTVTTTQQVVTPTTTTTTTKKPSRSSHAS